jgi:hypothetical protein
MYNKKEKKLDMCINHFFLTNGKYHNKEAYHYNGGIGFAYG